MQKRPLEFDPDNAEIIFYYQESTRRYVKLVYARGASTADSDELAQALWKEKYGEDMPSADGPDIEMHEPETAMANFIDYDGTVQLTGDEQRHVSEICDGGSDLTLEMLYFVLEGLGWRPLCSPADDDPGWADVLRREEEALFFADIVADLVFPDGVKTKERLAAIARIHAPELADLWDGTAEERSPARE